MLVLASEMLLCTPGNALLEKRQTFFKSLKKELMTIRSKQNEELGALPCLYMVGKMLETHLAGSLKLSNKQ